MSILWFLPHIIKEPYEWYILKKRSNYDHMITVLTHFKNNYKLSNHELFIWALNNSDKYNIRKIKVSPRRIQVWIGPYWHGLAIRDPETAKIKLLINA